jgi:hypothetical protein
MQSLVAVVGTIGGMQSPVLHTTPLHAVTRHVVCFRRENLGARPLFGWRSRGLLRLLGGQGAKLMSKVMGLRAAAGAFFQRVALWCVLYFGRLPPLFLQRLSSTYKCSAFIKHLIAG